MLGHCIEGISPAALNLLNSSPRPGNQTRPTIARGGGFRPDAGIVQSIVEMGFSQVSYNVCIGTEHTDLVRLLWVASRPRVLTSSNQTRFQGRVEEALRRIGANNVEAAMEWLIMHPEADPPPAAAAAGSAAAAAAAGTSAGGAFILRSEENTRLQLYLLCIFFDISDDLFLQIHIHIHIRF